MTRLAEAEVYGVASLPMLICEDINDKQFNLAYYQQCYRRWGEVARVPLEQRAVAIALAAAISESVAPSLVNSCSVDPAPLTMPAVTAL
ncbi:hypothetical protein EGR_10874 [Echinococcus granulosus]|uniref:Uncharacterized protein n=1 Tax=Echinococcus granulosus TaxID=6210 RepID=W6TZT8_ECHGR|nr:hypothetical protein EGR_10874 [Echinococcus granulosus]EUB54263.1 hypothetical protein EGR_10874 [Echinococcus granulosus]